MANKIKVAVLYGGRSSEHGISCLSAASVMTHLDRDCFDVVPIGITPCGRWVRGTDNPASLRIVDRQLPEVASGEELSLSLDPAQPLLRSHHEQAAKTLSDIDIVFPLLHGPYGEDGTLQGLLAMAGLPYVGAGVLFSAAVMDKDFTKRLVQAEEGLEVAPWVTVRRGQEPDMAAVEALGLPLFVKPARSGSSRGIVRVTDLADLATAIAAARKEDQKVLIESAVRGHEVEVAVLEFPDGRVEATAPCEIRFVAKGVDWYDFDAKYLDDACEFDIPALLPADVNAKVSELAVAAFHALNGSGLARCDFFITEEGRPVLNELNTMPGFTNISMFPKLWASTGLGYTELLSTMVETGLARGPSFD